MRSYGALAIRYVKMNLKRSIITVFGVVVTTLILFAGLNLAYSMVVAERNRIREEKDYEFVLLTESQQQVEQILSEQQVKSAYIGPYYMYNGAEEQLYPNALYVNTNNPYRMNAIFKHLCKKFDVSGEYNSSLARLYFQGKNSELPVVILQTTLLIAYIFTIFGVGIVRNSIQLCALENIRDYGNLRCIGASKGELKWIIFLQGAILELSGIGIGVILGAITSIIIGMVIHLPVAFQPLIVVAILILFMGDLYFTIGENCKLITGMTPIAAIRGEYRIRKEKLKLRDHNLFGKFFGIEGDYAYKNLMRHPLRFFRIIAATTLGIAAFITIAGFNSSINWYMKQEEASYGYYQLYFKNMLEPGKTIEQVQSTLPTVEAMQELADMEEVTEVKRMYYSAVYLTDPEGYFNRFTEEYFTTVKGYTDQNGYKGLPNPMESEESRISYLKRMHSYVAEIECYGYDASDYQRYQSVLLEGTLDISENGIVIVNYGNFQKFDYYSHEYIDVPITDYQIGDTIDIVDMKKYHGEIEEITGILEEKGKAEEERLRQEYSDDKEALYSALREMWGEIDDEKRLVTAECWNQLIENGDYQTYTIEGILKDDVNHYGEGFRIILPLEQYFVLTDTDESMNTGMQFHLERYPINQSLDQLIDRLLPELQTYNYRYMSYCMQSSYPWRMEELIELKNQLGYFTLMVIFVALMAVLNFINTIASNLHLRRREFAQLRVIGTSKERLMKMVLLEGIISTVLSDLLGILLGCAVSYGVFKVWTKVYEIITYDYAFEFHLPYVAIALSIVASFLLLCGAIYVPLKNLSRDLAIELKTGGD